MGLLGFARRRPAAEWLPESGKIMAVPGSQMDDDGCDGAEAYGARLRLDGQQDRSLTIWAYAVPGGGSTGHAFIVGYRIDYEIDYGNGEPWVLTDYHAEPYYSEWYKTPEAASEGARHDAAQFAASGSSAIELDVSPTAVAEWFGWDGHPW